MPALRRRRRRAQRSAASAWRCSAWRQRRHWVRGVRRTRRTPAPRGRIRAATPHPPSAVDSAYRSRRGCRNTCESPAETCRAGRLCQRGMMHACTEGSLRAAPAKNADRRGTRTTWTALRRIPVRLSTRRSSPTGPAASASARRQWSGEQTAVSGDGAGRPGSADTFAMERRRWLSTASCGGGAIHRIEGQKWGPRLRQAGASAAAKR